MMVAILVLLAVAILLLIALVGLVQVALVQRINDQGAASKERDRKLFDQLRMNERQVATYLLGRPGEDPVQNAFKRARRDG